MIGAAISSAGNSVVDQVVTTGKVDIGRVFEATIVGVAITAVTMGVFKAFAPPTRVPVSAITPLEPIGISGFEGGVLNATTMSTTQAASTTVANTVNAATVNASKEIAKVGLTSVKKLGADFSFNAVNQLDDVLVVAAKGGSFWSSTKALSAVANAFGHFKKHASEFPEFQNAVQYVKGARYFMNNEIDGQLTRIRPNGDFLKYHPQTNTFGITNSMGEIKTMFRPGKGMEYWLSLK